MGKKAANRWWFYNNEEELAINYFDSASNAHSHTSMTLMFQSFCPFLFLSDFWYFSNFTDHRYHTFFLLFSSPESWFLWNAIFDRSLHVFFPIRNRFLLGCSSFSTAIIISGIPFSYSHIINFMNLYRQIRIWRKIS